MTRVRNLVLAGFAVLFCCLFLLALAAGFTNSSMPWWVGVGGFVGAFVWLGLLAQSGD